MKDYLLDFNCTRYFNAIYTNLCRSYLHGPGGFTWVECRNIFSRFTFMVTAPFGVLLILVLNKFIQTFSLSIKRNYLIRRDRKVYAS